jgi:hypothetical protein
VDIYLTITKPPGKGRHDAIQRNIDRLIEKDYIEGEDDGMYAYVA